MRRQHWTKEQLEMLQPHFREYDRLLQIPVVSRCTHCGELAHTAADVGTKCYRNVMGRECGGSYLERKHHVVNHAN